MSKDPKDLRIPIMMSSAEVEAIDEWRFANKIATRAEAVRRLCQIGIGLEHESLDLYNRARSFSGQLYKVFTCSVEAIKTKSTGDANKLADAIVDLGTDLDVNEKEIQTFLHSAGVLKVTVTPTIHTYKETKEAVLNWQARHRSPKDKTDSEAP